MLTQSAWTATRKSYRISLADIPASPHVVVQNELWLPWPVSCPSLPTMCLPDWNLTTNYGPNYLDERQRNRQIHYHLKRLDALGVTVAPTDVQTITSLQT